MTNEEKAYIAGIIDGEGSIMLIRNNYNKFPSPCISISSTTLELLEWIKNTTHVGKIIKKKIYKEYHKDSYSFVVTYNDAINLMSEIYPFLVINSKRQRAKLIIDNYKKLTPRNGRYTLEMLEAKNNFYLDFLSLK